MDKKHYGSTLDSLFEEMGALQEMNERLKEIEKRLPPAPKQ